MLTFLLACPDPGEPGRSAAAAGDSAVAPLATHALVLVLDGTRFAETFGTEPSEASDVPGRELFADFAGPMLPLGTLLTGAVATNLTVTPPGHADAISGRHNSLALMTAPSGGGYYRPEYPTLFEAVEATIPGSTTSLVTNTIHLRGLEQSLYPGVPADGGALLVEANTSEDLRDQRVVDAVYEAFATDTLVVANLHDIDRGGHSEVNPRAYASKLESVAGELAKLWAWIESDASGGLAGTTLLVVTADHGRHDWEDDSGEAWDYAGHGDQCVGCRDIPIFVAGPGVKQGVEVDDLATLEDVGATVAFALGVPLPHSSGRVLAEAFDEDVPGQGGTGWLAVADDGTHATIATVDWTGDSSTRAAVSVDGSPVATTPFLAADPENLATGKATVTCWRELAGASEGDQWSWTARCDGDIDGVATQLAVPAAMVAPTWRPSLAGDGAGALLIAWAENPTGLVAAGAEADVRVARWARAADWMPRLLATQPAISPGNPSLAGAGDRLFVAWAASDLSADGTSINPSRYTRHVEVAEVGDSFTILWRAYTETCPAEAECAGHEPTLDDGGEDWGRMEFPALAARDDGLDLAWVSWGESGVTVHLARSDDTYTAWAAPLRIDPTGRVLGHVEPRWHDGTLYYARLTMIDTVEVCGWNGTLACVDTGASAISDLGAGRGGALALLYRDGNWAPESVSF
ncbi:MAG: hypothetical protein FJ102_13405 [Deltaproteobacteria bacterium]|nr:hypothetical protein [Deltaproteobacteria bacterium]